MARPLRKLKKMRGSTWDELRTRSEQAFSAYGEKMGFGDTVPTDEELGKLVDRNEFGSGPVTAETLWLDFYRNADLHFFPSFANQFESTIEFRKAFGNEACSYFVNAAELIIAGRIDLLGSRNLYIGTDIDWHTEPISGTRSPLKHWKEFDDLDSHESGDKKVIWELNRHQHFFKLGVAYWLTSDERYAESFTQQIESWIDQNPPGQGINWASSLEVSFRAMSWIWAFQFFRNAESFTPELFKRAIKHLYLHGRHIEKYLSKYYSPNTHLTGEALGLYYLGSQLPFLARAESWRKLGESILDNEVSRQILEDGVYFEQSTWYQRYTVDFYTQFVVLRSLYNNEPGGTPADILEKRLMAACDFLMHVTRPDGTTPIIGDDDGGRALPLTNAVADDFRGTLAAGAFLFGRGDLRSIAGSVQQEVFWLFGVEGVRSYSLIEKTDPEWASRAFPKGGYYSMRDGWLDTDNFLLVDCGEVGAMSGGHGHADTLAIEAAIQGKTLLVDSGTYTYHESGEMRDYFRSTKAHNTLTIDDRSSSEPGNRFGWKDRAEAIPRVWETDDRFDFFEGSHSGYRRLETGEHTRSILFLKSDYFIIRDLVETTGTHEYSLNFHLDVRNRPVLDPEGDFAGDDDWRIFAFGDGGRWQQNESWVSTNYGNKVNAPFLRFTAKGNGTQEFFTFILPADRLTAKPEVAEVPIAGGRAFAIMYREYTDLFVFNDDNDKTLSTEFFDTNYKYTWARIGRGETSPHEFVLVCGSKIEIAGHDLMAEADASTFAVMRRVGSDIYARTKKERFRISMP